MLASPPVASISCGLPSIDGAPIVLIGVQTDVSNAAFAAAFDAAAAELPPTCAKSAAPLISAPNLVPDHAPRPAIIPWPISPVRAAVASPIPPIRRGIGMPIAVPATPSTVGKIDPKNPASGRPVLGLVDSGLPT